jgi:hypothetical protein
MLTAEQQRARANALVTASRIPILMSGNIEKINRYWSEAIGEKEPEDISHKWEVGLGSLVGPYALDHHERKTQMEHTMREVFRPHPTLPYVGATLDAYRPADDTAVEVKTCGGWQRLDDVVAYYSAQVICQMRCIPCRHGALLIVHGGAEPVEIPVLPDPDYEKEMWARVAAFKLCCDLLIPPAPIPAVVPPGQWRTIDLAAADPWPNWAHELAFDLERWRDVRPIAIEFEEITAHVKNLLPDDVGRLDYAGLTIRRNRRGALTIRENGQ